MKNRFKKFMATLLMSTLLCTSAIGIAPVKAVAATRNEAVAWATAQLGKGLDYDGVYGNQCVDLIKFYYAYFGVAGYAMGNANAYITNNLPPGWTRVYSGYKPGDIAVWKTNHSCSTCSTTNLGHVGIITSADSTGFNAVNQNFNNNSYCTQNWFYCSALACAIRPSYSGEASQSTNITFAEYSQNFVQDTNAEVAIKIMNPNRGHVTSLGCNLYNSGGTLLKTYLEGCDYRTSYVNYWCNFNSDMKYTLERGTTYKFQLYVVVDGVTYKDQQREFKTTGSNDKVKPVISDVSVYNVTENGYTVRCKASDNEGVSSVQFPTWTSANGQDDIQTSWNTNPKASGTLNADGYYVYEVKITDHNNEMGEYITHIYAFDKAGNSTSYAVPAVTLKKNMATPSPTQTADQDNKADGNALVSVAQKEYETYCGQQYNSKYGSSPWCCNFVSWCARQAGISADVIKSTATVQTMYDSLINTCGATVVNSPQKGDLVFYKYTDYDSENFHHIGIMTGAFETIQGNVNNTWWKGAPDALNNIKQMVYVRPAYDGKYVEPGSAYFSDYNLDMIEETNAQVSVKVQNPDRKSVTSLGCEIYDKAGNLLKSYSEECSYTTSYVNYWCNFNDDMQYVLLPGTSYNFILYAIVDGIRVDDVQRTFTTKGDKTDNDQDEGLDDYSPTAKEPSQPTKTPQPLKTSKPSDGSSGTGITGTEDKDAPPVTLKKPARVNLKKVKAIGKKKARAEWNWFTGQNGFQLQYAQNKAFTKNKKSVMLNTYTSTVILKKMKRGKTYYFRVRAYNKSGGKKMYGTWSKVKKCKIK